MLTKEVLFIRRKELVLGLTASEKQLERELSRKNWRRKLQYRLGFYVLDFVFPYKMLVIELDGASHDNSGQYDRRRDAWIESFGFKVLRFPNSVAWNNPDTIIKAIDAAPTVGRKPFISAVGKASNDYERAHSKRNW